MAVAVGQGDLQTVARARRASSSAANSTTADVRSGLRVTRARPGRGSSSACSAPRSRHTLVAPGLERAPPPRTGGPEDDAGEVGRRGCRLRYLYGVLTVLQARRARRERLLTLVAAPGSVRTNLDSSDDAIANLMCEVSLNLCFEVGDA